MIQDDEPMESFVSLIMLQITERERKTKFKRYNKRTTWALLFNQLRHNRICHELSFEIYRICHELTVELKLY